MNSAAFGKRQAMGQKPDDCWTLPLCASCHPRDADALHRQGELQFFHALRIEPLPLCDALYRASPDVAGMRTVLLKTLRERGRP